MQDKETKPKYRAQPSPTASFTQNLPLITYFERKLILKNGWIRARTNPFAELFAAEKLKLLFLNSKISKKISNLFANFFFQSLVNPCRLSGQIVVNLIFYENRLEKRN